MASGTWVELPEFKGRPFHLRSWAPPLVGLTYYFRYTHFTGSSCHEDSWRRIQDVASEQAERRMVDVITGNWRNL